MISFVLPAMLIGATWGATTALRRGGRRIDAAQYGAVYAVILGLAGLFAFVLVSRLSH